MSNDLGPLAARVPEALRGTAAYHVPQPPQVRAKLDANELPYPLPEELRARLGAALAEVALERYPDPNARELRALVAKQLGVGGQQLVFGNGSDETIGMLVAAFAAPRTAQEHGSVGRARPAAILYPTPTFVYYKLAAVARGVEAIEVPLDAKFSPGPAPSAPRSSAAAALRTASGETHSGNAPSALPSGFEMDEAAIERAIETHRPSVVFLALPNNPTGTLWRMDFALELAARHRDVCVVSDEAYFAYSGKTNLAQLAAHPNLVVMRTLSKVGMAGVRVGFTVSSQAIAQLLEKVRPPYNVSSLDQRAAVFLLKEAADWCHARAAEVVRARAVLADVIAKLPRAEVFPSEANLLLVRFGAKRATKIWQGLADRGIVVRNFDRQGPLEGCLRITVGTPQENEWLIDALTELCT
ncbi:MAG TPA: aminotransferase class I/II-fold pyridoxal phosphate-dependent enzyme [Kofleriaceae bacterium]